MAATRSRLFLLLVSCAGSLLMLPSPGRADAEAPGVDRFSIPRDAAPSYLIESLASWGSRSDCAASRYFLVRPDGDIVVAGDLSTLAESSFSVATSNRQGAWKWQGVIYIDLVGPGDNRLRHHSDMLVFQQPFYEGHVLENSPGGSQVRALANIAVKHTHKHPGRSIQYRITAGGMIHLSSFQMLVLHTTQPLDRE